MDDYVHRHGIYGWHDLKGWASLYGNTEEEFRVVDADMRLMFRSLIDQIDGLQGDISNLRQLLGVVDVRSLDAMTLAKEVSTELHEKNEIVHQRVDELAGDVSDLERRHTGQQH